MSEKVMVDIVFNPDTKQLEKQTKDITDKNKVKIKFEKPDVKELEGPFKELQEKAMAMANGGFAKGLGQLKDGVSEFGNILKGGGDVSTAMAGGLSKIGMEGAVAAGALAAAAAAVAAVAVGTYKFIDAGQEQARVQRQLNIDIDAYASSLHGVVDVQGLLALKTAAFNNGLTLTEKQLAAVTVVARNMGQQTGDMAGSQELYTQAALGNIDAIRTLGLEVDTTASKMERSQQAIAAIQARRREQGYGEQTFGERMSEAWDIITRKIGQAGAATNEYFVMNFGSEQEQIQLVNQRLAREQEANRIAQNRRAISEATENLAAAGAGNAERALILAGYSVAAARDGLSTEQQRVISLNETANIQGEINVLNQTTAVTEAQRLEKTTRLTALYGRLASEQQKRNQLDSFSVQLADAQRQRLAQIALSQALHARSSVRQLSLSEQIKMAEAERLRISVEIALAGGAITEAQQQQLAGLQTFINQNRAQQAQAGAQTESMRQQNNLAELALRYANEEVRARGEAARSDIDAINIAERKLQIESALNGLYAYRGRTTRQEAARLAEIQRRTQELQQITQIQAIYRDREVQSGEAAHRQAGERINRERQSLELSRRLASAAEQQSLSDYAFALQSRENKQLGLTLTNSEISALARLNSLEERRNQILQSDRVELNNTRTQLQSDNLSAEERNRLLERRVVLIERIRNLEAQQRNEQQQAISLTSRSGKALEGLAGNYSSVGDAMDGLAAGAMQNFSGAFSNLIATAIEGKTSFGDAMLEMTRSVLTSLSQQALVQGLSQLALGFARLAVGDAAGSTAAFTSAGLYAAVGATAGLGAAFIPKPAEAASAGGGAGSSGNGVTGATSSQGNSRRESGPVVINFNMKPYSTQEDIEKGIAMTLYSYEQRIGRNTRRSR